MTAAELKKLSERAINCVNLGRSPETLEAEQGCSLSSLIDSLWDEAEEQGETALASRLEKAYLRITG